MRRSTTRHSLHLTEAPSPSMAPVDPFDPARMADRFHEELMRCLGRNGSRHDPEAARDLERYFLSCVSSLQLANRGARKANTALCRLNDLIERHISRVAHEIHDEAHQVLASVYLALADIERDASPGMIERLREIRRRLDRVEEQLRRISHEMRPRILHKQGLMPALQFLCEGVKERTGLEIALNGRIQRNVPPRVETTIYRVVQEALTNVARHARASRAEVRLRETAGVIRCSVRDDGAGFSRSGAGRGRDAMGLGLEGILVRLGAVGGRLRIRSSRGAGTEVIATIALGRTHG